MSDEHVLHGITCSCGWRVPLGMSIFREFDKHLLRERPLPQTFQAPSSPESR